jgi:hypothetical protein
MEIKKLNEAIDNLINEAVGDKGFIYDISIEPKYIDLHAVLKIDIKEISKFINDNAKVLEIDNFLKNKKQPKTQYREGGKPAELWVYKGKSVNCEISYNNNEYIIDNPVSVARINIMPDTKLKSLKDVLQYIIKKR